MSTGSTMGTAVLRSAYQAVGSGLAVWLITWGTTDDLRSSLIAGGIAALAALGFRGGFEGGFDANRDAKIAEGIEEPKSSDVGQPNAA